MLERFEVRNLARKRFVLGYPPRKATDTSIGDALNWEWIIRCAQKCTDNSNIVIVSRDGDFGGQLDGSSFLNDWLEREFKDRVSQKRKIRLTAKLSDALRLLAEVVDAADEEAEEKVIQSTKPTSYRAALGNTLPENFDPRSTEEKMAFGLQTKELLKELGLSH